MHRARRCAPAGPARAPTRANRAPALRPLRLHRLRAAPGCPRPSMSPSSRSGIVVQVVAIGKFCAHRPHRAYRAHRPHRARRAPPPASPSRVASAPGPWLARIAPHVSLFRRMREKGPLPGNFRPKCMLFEIKMATSSPYASISGRNRAIQDTWRANLAAKGPLSRRGTRNHAWREDVASAARPFRGSGMRHGRTGFAPCGAGLACLPHAPPCHLACARRRPRSSLPSCTRRASPSEARHAIPVPTHLATCARTHPARRRAAHCGRGERRSGSSCRPRAAHADASRPPMHARRHRPSPNPRQPSPSPVPTGPPAPSQPSPGPKPTGPRPPVEPPAPIRAPPLAAPHPAARVPLRFR